MFVASCIKNWFMIGIFVAVLMAKLEPSIGMKGGLLRPEYTIKYFAVALIFFNSGLSLKTEELKNAITQVQLHTFIQSFTLIFIPFFMQFVAIVMRNHEMLNPWLINGFIVVSCMPPPVSSAVILTKTVGGNEAAAIFNSALGSFLGIFVSPILILLTLGLSGDVPFGKIFLQLLLTVVVPIVAGQITRNAGPSMIKWLDTKKSLFGNIASFTLLMIIYSAFCDTFSNKDILIPKSELVTVLVFVILIQIFLVYFVFRLTQSSFCRFEKKDTICAMFCATHKSLTLGIPMLKIMYSGDPNLSFITIPLLMYHPCQILFGSLLAPKLKVWMMQKDSTTLVGP